MSYKSFEEIQSVFEEYGKLESIDSKIYEGDSEFKDGKHTLVKYEITNLLRMIGICNKIIHEGVDITNEFIYQILVVSFFDSLVEID